MKKKVLYFIPEFPKLTETFIHREVDKLAQSDQINLRVHSMKRASGAISERVEKITSYQRLNVIIFIFAFIHYTLTRFDRVRAAFNILKSDGKGFFKSVVLLFKSIGYAKIFERYHPDHIHAHFLSWPSSVVLVASKILNVPFSISAHARDVFVEGELISQKAKEAKFIAVCNNAAWERAASLAGDANRTKILKIYHGVDESMLRNGVSQRAKPDRPLIFSVARLTEKKGLNYLIDASKILRDRGVNHEVHIIGPGPLYDQLTAQIKELGLENYVYIEGEGRGLSFDEVREFYKVADIFVLPSIETEDGDSDGVPTVVIEAALSNIAIVTTSAGSISDLITEENGYIVPQKDAFRLATAMEQLIYHEGVRHELGKKAHDKAEEMFNLDKNVGELEKMFLR